MGSAALVVREPDSGPDAPDEGRTRADELEELGDEIARLAAHSHAAKHRVLTLVAEFDRRRGWEAGGHRSCAHWLSFRTGYAMGTAREHVRVAGALEELPRIAAAMARGRLSFCQVRELTRVATPETEEELVALAEGATVAQLERMLRAWAAGSREGEAARERERHRSRRLSVYPDDDGMYVVKGRLTAEVGALLMRALEAAGDALYREEESDDAGRPLTDREARRQASRRRADAAGLLAERALAVGFGPGADEDEGDDELRDVSGTRAERYQVFLHVDRTSLAADGEPGRSELEDGTRVPYGTSRQLTCDAAVVRVDRGEDGSVLDMGRRTRTIPPALRRALEVRDRGCRFPGCGLRFTDAHHITHWSDGGETSLDNTILLCRRHHRFVHQEGWTVEWWGKSRAVFTDSGGGIHLDERPPPPELPADPVQAMIHENRLRGVDPGPLDGAARWKREREIPDRVYFGALEAGFAATAPP